MMRGTGIWRRVKRVGAAFALAALAFKAAVPAGYMLSAQAHGVAVTICSSAGEYEAVLDLQTGQVTPKGHDSRQTAHDRPCPFAVAAIAASPSQAGAVAAPLLREFHIAFAPLAHRAAIIPAGPPLPARGPPHHA